MPAGADIFPAQYFFAFASVNPFPAPKKNYRKYLE